MIEGGGDNTEHQNTIKNMCPCQRCPTLSTVISFLYSCCSFLAKFLLTTHNSFPQSSQNPTFLLILNSLITFHCNWNKIQTLTMAYKAISIWLLPVSLILKTASLCLIAYTSHSPRIASWCFSPELVGGVYHTTWYSSNLILSCFFLKRKILLLSFTLLQVGL